MAKEKTVKLSGDRDLGTVAKRLSSGMFETNRGDKIPPFPGVTIGSKIRLVKNQFEIVGGKKEEPVSAADETAKENAALKKRIEALEKQMGERGSAEKVVPDSSGTPAATPPKVGE